MITLNLTQNQSNILSIALTNLHDTITTSNKGGGKQMQRDIRELSKILYDASLNSTLNSN